MHPDNTHNVKKIKKLPPPQSNFMFSGQFDDLFDRNSANSITFDGIQPQNTKPSNQFHPNFTQSGFANANKCHIYSPFEDTQQDLSEPNIIMPDLTDPFSNFQQMMPQTVDTAKTHYFINNLNYIQSHDKIKNLPRPKNMQHALPRVLPVPDGG